MTYFSILGDDFPSDEVTKILAIQPTSRHQKGDTVRNHVRKETSWQISTGYQESYDINDQLNPQLHQLEMKTNELLEIKRLFNASFMFMVVIQIENNESPATYLESRIINYSSTINAEIHFDLYVSS
ncbi:DUF4279 domain-containing protein [Brevibacillus halotolerans]|uniref:DUF4279 domain-containing protein n=1 Tax=Brevibacillus halotolerans TaxID=1507437 RepID=UPI0015EFCFE0|nr:DUF4279 domain-containing protein [Brevibacillus halotolerans]MBA4535360.1 DUF4279 domain-containing protein [Brevibacillus halotolerans]